MADYNTEPPAPSKFNQVQEQVNDVKVILKDNINKVLERGERLDDLIGKTDDLQATADSFQKTSTRVARKMWWRNTKMMIIIGVVVLAIIVLIILFATELDSSTFHFYDAENSSKDSALEKNTRV